LSARHRPIWSINAVPDLSSTIQAAIEGSIDVALLEALNASRRDIDDFLNKDFLSWNRSQTRRWFQVYKGGLFIFFSWNRFS
jgi:hypothetical protein